MAERAHRLLLALLSVAACADRAEALRTNPIRCQAQSDCDSGAMCVSNICLRMVLPAGPLGPFDIELNPPAESGLVKAQRLALTPDSAAPLALSIPNPVVFSSSVYDTDGQAIAAKVTVFGEPSERITGREVDRVQTFSASSNHLAMLPGVHRVRIEPIDRVLPGWETSFEVRTPNSGQTKDFEPRRFHTLEGVVTWRTQAQSRVEGVTVRAYAVPSGLPSPSQVTGGDGMFSLRLPEADSTTAFCITADPPHPPAFGFVQCAAAGTISDRSFEVHLEQTASTAIGLARLRILGDGPSGPEPVGNARVTLSASTAIDSKVFQLVGLTDPEGYFVPSAASDRVIALPEARYQLSVAPQPTSPYQHQRASLDLLALDPKNQTDRQLLLPPKVRITGVALSANGLPLVQAQIEAESLSDGTEPISVSTTDASGAYQLVLDPGLYLVRVSPATLLNDAGEILPVGFADGMTVPDRPGQTVVPDPIRLPAGAVLSGITLGPAGEVVPKTEVSVFTKLHDRAVSLGRASTDPNGAFSLVLPIR